MPVDDGISWRAPIARAISPPPPHTTGSAPGDAQGLVSFLPTFSNCGTLIPSLPSGSILIINIIIIIIIIPTTVSPCAPHRLLPCRSHLQLQAERGRKAFLGRATSSE